MPILGLRTHLRIGHTGKLRRILAVSLTVLALLTVVAFGLRAAETKSKLTREYDLKAAFLFNFVQFVEWPPEAFPATDSPIIIGILGEDPFGTSLDQIVANEVIRNLQL